MPEIRFRVRWPDGQVAICYSPSTIIKDFLVPGRSYPLNEFLAACRGGLNAASDRVSARYGGLGCSRAMAQLAAIEHKVATLEAERGAMVRVEGFVS